MLHLSCKIDEAITNRLRDEIQTKYGVTVDAAADKVVDNLQIQVSCVCVLLKDFRVYSHVLPNFEVRNKLN